MMILDSISETVGIKRNLLQSAVANARRKIKLIRIKKADGGERKAYHPSRKHKIISYWLIENIFKHIQIHQAAMAYRKNISTKHNAAKHASKNYVLKIDLKDFFPSITFNDLWPYVERWHNTAKPNWDCDDTARMVIRQICFYKEDKLAIGFPTSPIISNIVMNSFDNNVLEALTKNRELFGEVVYTRYADDMVFSVNKVGTCNKVYAVIHKLIQDNRTPKIKINNLKTKYVSNRSGSTIITGIRVCRGAHLTIHKKQKDEIRLLLSLLAKNKLRLEDFNQLRGHLNYAKYIDPAFYTKMCSKYFSSIEKLDRHL